MKGLIDFTEIVEKNSNTRKYGGANGAKKGINIDGVPYMLKIDTRNQKKREYINNIFSEYISCKIYSELGIPTQEVILGKITDGNKEKLCVACKDFKEKGEYLYDFISIKNSASNNISNGSGTELSEILTTIENEKNYNSSEVKERFWDMFVVDAYLGNFDRHNGNWGVLVNEEKNTYRIAPVYDCGSCLFPGATDEQLEFFLSKKEEMLKRIYIFPTSAIKQNDKKINYYEFLTTTTNEDCINSLKKIFPKIQEKNAEIEKIIDDTKSLSPIRKKFYKTILDMRKEHILEKAFFLNLEKTEEKEKSKRPTRAEQRKRGNKGNER